MRTRRVVGAVVAALAASSFGVMPAAADHVQARSIESACADAPEDGLTDTGANGSEQETAVDCIAWYDVTQGVTRTEYRPTDDVVRGQMAAFLARVMRPSNTAFEEPGDDENHFADDNGGLFEQDIDFVAKHDVADGFTETQFRPTLDVTRGQMARFLVNMLTAIGAELPDPSQDYFSDDDGGMFEDDINTIAELGIAAGFTETEYRPNASVNRGQMARFLARSLAELTDQDLMLTPAEREVDVTLDATEVERGSDVSGDITSGSAPQSAVLDGCGLTDQALEDGNPAAAGIQFSATIPTDQELGACTLTFDVALANGQSQTVQRVITVEDERDATVVLNQRRIAQGQELTGSIFPDEGVTISSAEVDGCGLAGQGLTDQDAEEGGLQFAVTIPNSQTTGDCNLTFTVNYAALGVLPNGGSDTFTETITVTAGAAVATGAPELVGVSSPTWFSDDTCGTTAPSGSASHVRLGLTFDEAITGRDVTAVAAGFGLVGYDASRAAATASRLSATDDRIAEACFPADAYTTATTVTVSRDTVGDAGNLGNPEGDLGVRSLTLTGTTAPELTGGRSLSADQYRFDFDEPIADNPNNTLFRLVLADGRMLSSTLAEASGTTVTATFPDHGGKTITRIAALNGAVESANDGDANAITVRRVANSGLTAAPDLAGVTYDPDATRTRNIDADNELETVQVDEVRFTFDVSVLEQADNADRFELIAADGTRTQPAINGGGSGDPVARSGENGRVVIVEFPDGALDTATIATVYANAVRAAGGSQPQNQPDALARSPRLTYTSGTTLAPAATAASVTSTSNVLGTAFTVRVTFDEVVDPDTLGSGSISLYDDQGRRFTISGTPTRDEANPDTIEITSSAQMGTNAQIGNNAVLVGIAPSAVSDGQGNASHAQVTIV